MNKIKKSHVKIGDKVKVICGSQKGFIGTIASISRKKSIVSIEGILPRVKFVKNRKDGESTKIEIPVFIHVSNVMLWDNVSQTAGKIGYKEINNEKKRFFKKSGNIL
jgi:large subunit ribosomal protein L24